MKSQQTKDLLHLIQKALSLVKEDIYSDFRPLSRAAFYSDLNSLLPGSFETFFIKLQFFTLKNILPLWSEKPPEKDNSPFELLEKAEQISEDAIGGHEAELFYQEKLMEIELAEMLDVYEDQDTNFAVIATAVDTLGLVVKGFDCWEDFLLENDATEDELPTWGNDSAKWASIAVAGWISDTTPEKKQKRLAFWEWWLTEAIPQAWELAQQEK